LLLSGGRQHFAPRVYKTFNFKEINLYFFLNSLYFKSLLEKICSSVAKSPKPLILSAFTRQHFMATLAATLQKSVAIARQHFKICCHQVCR